MSRADRGALLAGYAADVEVQIGELEEAADNITREVERVNLAAAAVAQLVASMRREAERART